MWDWANLRGDPAPRRVPPRGEPAPRGGDPAPLEGELAPLLLHALRSRLRLGSLLRRGGERIQATFPPFLGQYSPIF